MSIVSDVYICIYIYIHDTQYILINDFKDARIRVTTIRLNGRDQIQFSQRIHVGQESQSLYTS